MLARILVFSAELLQSYQMDTWRTIRYETKLKQSEKLCHGCDDRDVQSDVNIGEAISCVPHLMIAITASQVTSAYLWSLLADQVWHFCPVL